MPVISPRRSSTSGSASFYRTTAPSVTNTSSNSPTTSYLDRSNSVNKITPSSSSSYNSYHSFLKSYSPSSYTPNTSSYRSSYISPSSYLSGGSSTLGTYRSTTGSHLDSGSTSANDVLTSTSSRYGLNKKPPIGDTLRRGDTNSGSYYDTDRLKKKPPTGENNNGNNKRLSGSFSSSSLARLVATSAADIYEKYSPAHYKPNTELTTSSSRSSIVDSNDDNDHNNNKNSNHDDTTTNVTLERPRSRFSRLYSNSESSSGKVDQDTVDYNSTNARTNSNSRRNTGKLSNSNSTTSLGQSNSSNDVPTAYFTLRSSRASSKAKLQDKDDDGSNQSKLLKNGVNGSNNDDGLDARLKDLKLSNSSNNLNLTTTDDNKDIVNGSYVNNLNSNCYKNGSIDVADVSITATLKLDDNAGNGNSKVRNTTSMRMSTASPVSSRNYDRSTARNSTYSSSGYNGDGDNSNSTTIVENKEGLVGLRNIGNTCFMNSIIQCLSHTTELTKFLRQYEQSSARAAAKDHHILNEFAKLIKDMWSGNCTSTAPMELKRAFSTKHRMYSDFNQQDAQEFLRFFLDSLHCALNTGVKGEPLKIDDNLSDNKKAELTWEWYTRHENSLIRDLFVGQLKSTLRCTVCGNASVTFDPFWDLSVPLPSSSRIKLDHCLEWFIREEVLDGDEMPTCSKCKTRRKSTKSFSIQRFPKYLVIHLKRFSETRWSKLSNVVEFPTEERELNMGPYGSNPNSNVYYSLYAISNHMGSTAGGHYVALCKQAHTRRWHEFNDNVVNTADKGQLVSSSAYILFYERS